MFDQGASVQPAQESPLLSRLTTLDKRVTELSEQLGQLDGRLGPLLLPMSPAKSGESSTTSAGTSDVIARLHIITAAVEGLIAGVKQLSNRLTI